MFAPTSNAVGLIFSFLSLVAWGIWVPVRHKCRTDLFGWVMLSIPTQMVFSLFWAFTLGQISSDAPGFNNETFLDMASHSFGTWQALFIVGGGFFGGVGDMFAAAST